MRSMTSAIREIADDEPHCAHTLEMVDTDQLRAKHLMCVSEVPALYREAGAESAKCVKRADKAQAASHRQSQRTSMCLTEEFPSSLP